MASLAGCSNDSSSPGETTTGKSTNTDSNDRLTRSSSTPTSEPDSTRTTTRTVESTSTMVSQQGGKTTTPSRTPQEMSATCGSVTGISFYALGEIANTIWTQSSVWVDLTLETTAQVQLVALENDNILGTTRASLTTTDSTSSASKPITLQSSLSGEHTIRVVAYPAIGEDSQFNPEEIEPCQNENKTIQTKPTTIDFSRFPPGTPVTSLDGE